MPTPITSLTALKLVTPLLPHNTSVLSTDSSVLPFIIDADLNTTRIEIGIYNTIYGLDSGGARSVTTGSTTIFESGSPSVVVDGQNQFKTSIAITPSVAQTNINIVGRNYDPFFVWQPNTQYAIGQRYADPNGNVQQVVASNGTSNATQPTWSTIPPITATTVSVAGNVLTITSPANTFQVGQQVYLSGFQSALFLNGQIVTVSSSTPGVSFSAPFSNVPYGPTADLLGMCQIVTVDNNLLWANIGSIAVTPVVRFALLFFQSDLSVAIGPPSGITADKNQTDCLLQWVTPTFPGFIGVRVMISTDPAGVNPPFTQYGDLVTSISSQVPTTIATSSATTINVPTAEITNVAVANSILTIQAANSFPVGAVVELSGLVNATFLEGTTVTVFTSSPTQFTATYTFGDQIYGPTADTGEATSIVSTNTVTNTNTVMQTDYSSVNIPFTFVNNNIFYAMFSTVIQDPLTNIMYESVQNGPLQCGFVNLKVVNPTDFPVLQRKEDIAGRLIGQIVRQLPNLDLSPRSEIRDLFVDPFSIELANMSVREWFARVSASISAITQVDNVSGNGISDPFQSSAYKQQIARAYGLSATDTQNLINEQFDILGEQAGFTRGPASASTVVVTFYTFQQPQASITIPQGAVVSSIGDPTTPSLTFTTLGQGIIDITNLASFYNPSQGYWAVSVPAQCNQTGSVGNVGAGTIQQAVSGVPTGVLVNNLVAANFGTDEEVNSAFAARIQARLVTGIDSSSANGYLVAALGTPGVTTAQVVAAGDLEMLRDWDPTRQKHVFGCVDIYVRGTTLSQQDEFVPFAYATNGTYGTPASYATLSYLGNNTFQIQNFNSLAFPPYDGVELLVSRGNNTFYLSLDRAQFNLDTGYIIVNSNDIAYQYTGSSITLAKTALIINTQAASNFVALSTIAGPSIGTYTFQLITRLKSPFSFVPSLQPVLQVYSVTGSATGTGSVSSTDITLVHTSDFLLQGGSNNAGDTVQIALTSSPLTNTIVIGNSLSVPTVIDYGMDQPLDANGNPLNVISVLSTNTQTLYEYGVDYGIVAMGPYHQYGVQPLTSSVSLTQLQIINNVLTVTAPNDFGVGASIILSNIADPTFAAILNGNTVVVGTATATQFTATFTNPNLGPTSTTGLATGSAIQPNQQVVVTYNKFNLYEHLSYVYQEQQVLTGSLPITLDNDGFVRNTWLPQSYTTGVPSAAPSVPGLPGIYPVTPGSTELGDSLVLDGWNGFFGPDGGLDIVGVDIGQSPSTGLVGAQVPYTSRYIKVTYFNGVSNAVMKENIDFTLEVNPITGSATLTRILTGHIPDGGTVLVSYFITETFTVSTQYPAFVETLAQAIALPQSAACSVLIKAMVANPVDITIAVTLDANTSPETVDPVIRTVINIALDNAVGTLFQSALIQQIQSVTGVQSVEIPLLKCAKSDGSYDIGVVVPTGTKWIQLSSDPVFAGLAVPPNSWITANQVLPDSTIPSGGEPTAIVDFLYQGQVFQRSVSVQNFLSTAVVVPHLAVAPGAVYDTPGSFYIIGVNDSIVNISSAASWNASTNYAPGQVVSLNGGEYVAIVPSFNQTPPNTTYWLLNAIPEAYAQKVIVTIPTDLPNPGNLPYFATYQVFDEGGATDVSVSSTEYLAPGTITINYVTPATATG